MLGQLPDKPLRTLGERLKHWRVARGYKTRKALSNACGPGVSATAISDLESGRQHSSTRLLRIASVLKINPHYLETGEGDPLDLKALPPPILNNQHLLALIAEEDIADLSETELDLARYKFREVIENILKKRPRRKSQDKRA